MPDSRRWRKTEAGVARVLRLVRPSHRGGRSAFTLLELVALLLILGAVSALWLPGRYEHRLAANEHGAEEVLRMIQSAQACWLAERGRYAALGMLANAPDADLPRVNQREALLPFLKAGSHGRALYGGYEFSERRNDLGHPGGVLARPSQMGYSGRRVFLLEYAQGSLVEIEDPGPPPLY